jgi:hypothetical protein
MAAQCTNTAAPNNDEAKSLLLKEYGRRLVVVDLAIAFGMVIRRKA